MARGETEETEALKKQFEVTGRQLVAVTGIMKAHVARVAAVGGPVGAAGAEQTQAQGETSTSSPAQSNHPQQQQDAPKSDSAQTHQQPKPTTPSPAAHFPMPPPNQSALGHQRQRSLQDLQRGGDASPSLMNRMPSGPNNNTQNQLGPESQRRGWQGIFSWSGLDPNTQERKEVQTMVSAYFPDEARVNQAYVHHFSVFFFFFIY